MPACFPDGLSAETCWPPGAARQGHSGLRQPWRHRVWGASWGSASCPLWFVIVGLPHNLGLLPPLYLPANPFFPSLLQTLQPSKSGVFATPAPLLALVIQAHHHSPGLSPCPGTRLRESVQPAEPRGDAWPQSQWIWSPALYSLTSNWEQIRLFGDLGTAALWLLYSSSTCGLQKINPGTAEGLVPTMACSGRPWSRRTRPSPVGAEPDPQTASSDSCSSASCCTRTHLPVHRVCL